jgi:hypothetical protein
MEDAPRNGEVIEALFEGDWIEVFWSERAEDGSPYGTEGWATFEDRMLILDLEGWRPAQKDAFVDEGAEDALRIQEAQEAIADARRANRKPRRKLSEVKAELEAQHLALFGEDIAGTKYSVPVIRQKNKRERDRRHAEHSLNALGQLMKGFRL